MQNIVFQRIRIFELLIIRKEENAMCLLQEKCIGLGREGYRETRALKKSPLFRPLKEKSYSL